MAHTADLQLVADALAANEKAALDVVDGLTQTQLESQPLGGWSILQCLEHLALANQVYSEAIEGCLKIGTKTRSKAIQPSPLGRMFLSQLEPPVARKVRAPRKIVPGSGRTRDAVLSDFDRSHRKIRELIDAASGLDLNSLKFRNPLLPLLRVRAGTGFLIMSAHERRHLWQANQVRAAILKSS